MSIVGCDFSTRFIDLVKLDETTDAATWHRFELTGQDAFERARYVGRMMPSRSTSFWDDVIAVGIEEPRGYNAGALYRIQGGILASIPLDRLVQPWVPSSWRKTVGLAGNASKGAVALWAGRRFPLGTRDPIGIPWPQDAADALCIAFATRTSLIEVGEAA